MRSAGERRCLVRRASVASRSRARARETARDRRNRSRSSKCRSAAPGETGAPVGWRARDGVGSVVELLLGVQLLEPAEHLDQMRELVLVQIDVEAVIVERERDVRLSVLIPITQHPEAIAFVENLL